MKKYALALIFAASAFTAQAQNADATVSTATAASAELPLELTAAPATGALPEGVITTSHPLKLAFLAQSNSEAAVYRPSDNMPEIVDEDVMRGMREAGDAPGTIPDFAGYLPKLRILPCATGCSGEAYEKAVAHFARGYGGENKHFKPRGVLILQVRWFNRRGFLERQLPYGADVFGISFLYEGKLVSLGRSSGVGLSGTAEKLAEELGARLAVELAFTVGMGAKPQFLTTPSSGGGVVDGLVATTAAVNSMLGAEDVRSRIEPATGEAHKHLTPAIDGIAPGEVAPLAAPRYIATLF